MSLAVSLRTQNLVAALVLLFAFYVVSTFYVGINGTHDWRQADAYAQILGYSGYKDYRPLEDFRGHTAIYDIPIYAFMVAKLAFVTGAEPLAAAKCFNLGWLLLLVWGGVSIAEGLKSGAGVYFVFLLCTSRVFLHYFSAPMPDDMALALAVAGAAILLRTNETWAVLVGSALFFLAALIKSPIPFVFVVLFAAHSLLSGDIRRGSSASYKALIPLSFALVGALAAEQIRKNVLGTDVGGFAQDPTWYFGTFHQRLSPEFWLKIPERLIKSNPLVVFFILPAIYYCLRNSPRRYIAFVSAFFAGWLVFSNVYFIHDYYEMPVDVIAYVLLGVGVEATYADFLKGRWAEYALPVRNIGLAIAALLCVIYMPKLSNLATASIYDSVTYALRGESRFIWVDDGYDGPAIGGHVGTQFEQKSHADFERDCAHIVAANSSILVKGYSDCLAVYKSSASTYIEDGGFQFYLRKAR